MSRRAPLELRRGCELVSWVPSRILVDSLRMTVRRPLNERSERDALKRASTFRPYNHAIIQDSADISPLHFCAYIS
jgi:hypothetical protein